MQKPTVEPTCKYGHGALSRTTIDGNPAAFAAQVINGKAVQMNQGFTFTIYECPQCTYLEFHDIDLA